MAAPTHRQRASCEAFRIFTTTTSPSRTFDALVDALERAYLAEAEIARLRTMSTIPAPSEASSAG